MTVFASITDAVDAIYGVVKAALDGNPLTENVDVLWEDTPGQPPKTNPDPDPPTDPKTPAARPWVRVVVRHGGFPKVTLGNHQGKSRWRSSGLLVCQVFTPSGDGRALSDGIAQVILGALRGRGPVAGVQFTNPFPEEIGLDGTWFQVNVQATLEYDMIQ